MILRDQQRVGLEIEEEIQQGDHDVKEMIPNMFLFMLIGKVAPYKKVNTSIRVDQIYTLVLMEEGEKSLQSPRRFSPGIYHTYFTTISRNMKK